MKRRREKRYPIEERSKKEGLKWEPVLHGVVGRTPKNSVGD